MTTVSSARLGEEEEEGQPEEVPSPLVATAQSAQRVRSVTPVLPMSDSGERESHALWSPEVVRMWLQTRVAAFAAREFDVIHGPPPTLAAMHKRHQVAASHWSAALISKPRMVWGLLHTALAAILYAVLDALFSPFGALFAVLFIAAAIHYWL